MKNEDKLQMYHTRQFLSLFHLVEEWISQWSIWKKHPLYVLFEKNEKLEKDLLNKILKNAI